RTQQQGASGRPSAPAPSPRRRRPGRPRPAPPPPRPAVPWPDPSLGGLRLLVDDLGVLDHLVVRGSGAVAVSASGSLLLLRARLRVDRLSELLRGLLERLRLLPDLVHVRALEHAAKLHHATLDRRGVGLVELVAVLLERALGLVREALRRVTRVCELAQSVRLIRVGLGLADHPLDLLLLQTGAALDPDLLLVAGAEILRRHVDDPVGVDVEGDLDLRHSARRRRDADELEL